MEEINSRQLAVNLLAFIPYMFNNFIKDAACDSSVKKKFYLLMLLKRNPNQSMTYYSEQMSLPKSNITLLVDKLVKEGYAERVSDDNDRRYVYTTITDEGIGFIEETTKHFEEHILKKLEAYEEEDIESLYIHITRVMDIIKKQINKN